MAKTKDRVAEMRQMGDAELLGRLGEARRELFNLRFQLATGQLDNPSRIGQVRRDVARMLTVLRAREILEAEEDHQPHVGMIAIENTHMPSGGTPWNVSAIAALAQLAGERPVHLDGARLFNASVATGVAPAAIAAPASRNSIFIGNLLLAWLSFLLT